MSTITKEFRKFAFRVYIIVFVKTFRLFTDRAKSIVLSFNGSTGCVYEFLQLRKYVRYERYRVVENSVIIKKKTRAERLRKRFVGKSYRFIFN